VFHKLGWRGLPSIALNFGERGDCRGWLVGEPDKGIAQMFQMMNGARLMVGLNGVSTASVAYLESLEYATTRPQGRALSSRDPAGPQVSIIEHADVRRMLLRQKAIVEGGLALLATTSRYADLSEHAQTPEERHRALLLLDLLTPLAKTFPADRGFESNTLAVQIHGGYGYTSEYLPEAWLRDQKLNSIHEGTSGIQSLDLLGRKAVAEGGAALVAFSEEVELSLARAAAAGVEAAWIDAVRAALQTAGEVTMQLAQLGLGGDREGMLLHSADYLDLLATLAIGWQWIAQAAAAREGLARGGPDSDFYRGKLSAAQYWIRTELPRIPHLASLCTSGEDSYAKVRAQWL
jgi:butyryl-CoA dehydrogenase